MECSLTIDGVGLTIVPVRLGQLSAFVRAVEPFAKSLASGHLDLFELLSDHGSNVVRALEVATGQPRAWVEGLALDEAVRLASAVLEVNADFLSSRVLPALNTALAALPQTLTPPSTTGSSISPQPESQTL